MKTQNYTYVENHYRLQIALLKSMIFENIYNGFDRKILIEIEAELIECLFCQDCLINNKFDLLKMEQLSMTNAYLMARFIDVI